MKPTFLPRSKHHLRLSQHLVAPLVLYLASPSTFTQETFDTILSNLYELIPKDIIIEPTYGHFWVQSSYTPEKPYYHPKTPQFCYYWIESESYHTLCIPKEEMKSMDNEKLNSEKKSERRTQSLKLESLNVTNMDLVVCVLSETSNHNSEEIPIHVGLKPMNQISQFFESK